jgi:hypothetical protein
MLLEGFIVGKLIYDVNKTIKIDEQTQKKYTKAYERRIAAERLKHEKHIQVDNSLRRVANRKKAILSTSMPDFLDIYEKIMKINFVPGDGILELDKNIMAPAEISQIRGMTVTAISPMTDKELVISYLLKGLGGAMVDDSKRNLAMASSQMKVSNVIYSQAETYAVASDAIIERSNRIATLLARMDLLFFKSIQTSNEVIIKNGFSRKKYTSDDRKVLMTCINLADAIKKILDAPLIDENGKITQESFEALQVGNEYLQELEAV